MRTVGAAALLICLLVGACAEPPDPLADPPTAAPAESPSAAETAEAPEPTAAPAETAPGQAATVHVVVPADFVAPSAGAWVPPAGLRLRNDTPEPVAVIRIRDTMDVWGWVETEVDGTWERPQLECGFMLQPGTLAPGESAALNFSETYLGRIAPGQHRISADVGEQFAVVAAEPFEVAPPPASAR